MEVLSRKLTTIILSLFILLITNVTFATHNTSHKISNNHKTTVIYLMGLAGTGKYTIAKKIANHGYKIVDNHLISNPIFSLMYQGGLEESLEGTQNRISKIRRVVYDYIKDDKQSNYVLTNQTLENKYYRRVYSEILNVATKRDSLFIPVKLTISSKERARRIVQPERAKRFKITDVEEISQPKELITVNHQNVLELDVTHLSANEAADKILQHIQKLKLSLSSLE